MTGPVMPKLLFSFFSFVRASSGGKGKKTDFPVVQPWMSPVRRFE